MGLSKIDSVLAKNYAQSLLEPIKYGENGVFFWFPGSGMTTIVMDVFRSRPILRKYLCGLADHLEIVQLWGHLATERSWGGLLEAGGYKSREELHDLCLRALKKGKEVVLVLGRIDNFPEKEKILILKMLIALNAINRRRIYVIFNSIDKPWFEQVLKKYPELMVLVNRLEILPLAGGVLLDEYIQNKSALYGYQMTAKERKEIKKTYGGILILTKEYLRKSGISENLDLKLNAFWNFLPKSYQQEIENQANLKGNQKGQIAKDLEKFGVLNLDFYKKHGLTLTRNAGKFISKVLSPNEKKLWNFFKAQSGRLVSKDEIIQALWGEKQEEVSLWMVDQTISRFRKKLALVGIDPEQLETVKKRGYKWKA